MKTNHQLSIHTLHMGLLAMLALTMILPMQALAFCAPFWPPTRTFFPENNMHVFIHHDNGRQDMVVQPAFTGNVEDFGLVVAVPGEPILDEAPETIFNDLEDYTNPRINTMMMAAALPSFDESINVVRREFIGDFFATIFTADNVSAMTQWLDQYNYAYTTDDVANFSYYINSSKDYHFVALRINTAEVPTDANGNLSAKLNPIELNFATNQPIVPTRIMKGDMGQVSITLYTLSDAALYIPGIDTQYARRVNNAFGEWSTEYDAAGKMLVRQRMDVVTNNIVRDELLSYWSGAPLDISIENAPFTLNSRTMSNGIIPGNAPRYTGTVEPPVGGSGIMGYENLVNGSRLLRWGSRGADVRELQKFINNYVLSSWETKLVEDGIWGPKTNQGVRDFQTRFNIKIDGIVGPQTRGMLREFLNNQTGPIIIIEPDPYPMC